MNTIPNIQVRGMLSKEDKIATNEFHGPYTCPELGRNAGLCDTRFHAYQLPSRMGSRLVYPKRQYGEAP